MAGAIRTEPASDAYRDGWERNFGRKRRAAAPVKATLYHEDSRDLDDAISGDDDAPEVERDALVMCAYCGRTDLEVGQECACLSRASGAASYSCRRCGRPAQHVGELCDGCEWERSRPRRERELRASGLLRG